MPAPIGFDLARFAPKLYSSMSEHMIDELELIDWGIVAGAAAMAVGAFCPIVSVPILGSLNYVMGGRGDGIFVVGGSMAIILLVFFGYRRTTAIVAGGLLMMMATTVVKFASGISMMQADAVRSQSF